MAEPLSPSDIAPNLHPQIPQHAESEREVKPELDRVKRDFKRLCAACEHQFPDRGYVERPTAHGVYVIKCGERVLHVGRTIRAKRGLAQRLSDHLRGNSSFIRNYMQGKGFRLRNDDHTYQYVKVRSRRARALLEHYAISQLCPAHLGLG